MKAPRVKLKFDFKQVQAWLIRNVEKLVAGALALVALYYVYGAVTRETFDKTADELQQLVARAQSNRNSSTPTGPEDDPKPPKYDTPAHVILKEVSSEGKLTSRPWAPPVVPIDTRRGQPKMLPVQELQVAADYGAFRCRGRDGIATTKGFSWIVVTGLIPYEAQLDEYAKSLGLSEQRGDYDVPTYNQYEIQRAQVAGDGENEQPSWETIATWPQQFDPKRAPWLAPIFRDRLWEAAAEEVVPSEYILEAGVVDPLGPLAFEKVWGRSVGHEKFPMPKFDAPTAAPAEEASESQFDGDDSEGGAEGSEPAGDDEGMDLTDAAPSAESAPTAASAPAPARPSGGGLGNITFKARPGAGPKPAAAPAAAASRDAGSDEPPPEDPQLAEARQYKLFRFFDFRAQSGVRYKYRVRLRAYNPNFGIAEQHVRADANVEEEHVWTEYSQPSQMVAGPRLNNVLVGPIANPDGRNAEAVLNMLVRQFDIKTGVDMATAQKVSRGQVANYREQIEGKTVEYKTNMLVVDVLGGERLTVAGDSKQSIPGLVALLDPSGNLVVQTETSDVQDYNLRLANIVPPDQPGRKPKDPAATVGRPGGETAPAPLSTKGGLRGLLEAANKQQREQ